MPYKHWWEIKSHILYVAFSGDLTADELLVAMRELVDEMLINGSSFVNIISDTRNVHHPLSMPEVMKVIRHFKRPAQTGWLITVGDMNPIMRFTNNVAGQALGYRMHSVDTPEEAIDFLRERDPSIVWASYDSDSPEP